MRRLWPPVLALVLSLTAGCGVLQDAAEAGRGDGIDRTGYYAARDVVAAAFPAASPAEDGPGPPAVLTQPPGLPVSDVASATAAILELDGAGGDPLLRSAAEVMARQMVDPARACGPVEADAMGPLLTERLGGYWRAEVERADGYPYRVLARCDSDRFEVRVTRAQLLRASSRAGRSGDGVRVSVDVLYLLPGADGPHPVTHTARVWSTWCRGRRT